MVITENNSSNIPAIYQKFKINQNKTTNPRKSQDSAGEGTHSSLIQKKPSISKL